jgi:hypothetical protein
MPGSDSEGFDRGAAVTRSLLGWGVVAGIFYLVVGVANGLLREGFSFTEHALSLLMLGEYGWIQTLNLIVSGLMVVAASLGAYRVMKPKRAAGTLVGIYGLALVGSGIFPPDPVEGFPDSGSTVEATLSGVLHLAFGGVGFLALGFAALAVAKWHSRHGDRGPAIRSRLAGAVVIAGFLGGVALATSTAGVVLLWFAVVTGWAWLAATSLRLYRTVPHPDQGRRVPA